MDNYTKGKWEHCHCARGYGIFSGNILVAQINNTVGEFLEEKANAERICQCVNNFDDLLEACKGILAKQQDDSIFRFPDNCEEIINLRKAIQKAEK